MDCRPADTNGVLTLPSGREHPHSAADERSLPCSGEPARLASSRPRISTCSAISRRAALRSCPPSMGSPTHDVRRPMVPSATNLLGLVKHLVGIELSYLGDSVGRPSDIRLPWVEDGSVWDDADMWATQDESRDHLLGLYRAAWLPFRRLDRRARSRGTRQRLLVARGSGATRRSATCSCEWSPRPPSTPATRTSCASSSTAVAATITSSSSGRMALRLRQVQSAADQPMITAAIMPLVTRRAEQLPRPSVPGWARRASSACR